MSDYDVIVVGAGNAALAAANSAREQGAERVLVLEKAPEKDRGGNTHYSGGLLRIAYGQGEALKALVPEAEDELPGFFEDVPKGFEKVNAFRRWIHEELMGGKRPMGKNGSPTKYAPNQKLTQLPSRPPAA